MNRLPIEVLREIFVYLPLDDKVECLVVCKLWYRVITSTVLQHTLLLSNRHDVDTLLSSIQEKPDKANRIEKIMFNFGQVLLATPLLIISLLQALPNIRTVIFAKERSPYVSVVDGAPFAFQNQIEHIVDDSYFHLAYQLLSYSVCPRLKTLAIDDFHGRIISHLNNAPALRDLTLHTEGIRIDDIEVIHASLPQLARFRLCRGSFIDTTHDTNITAAVSLTSLVLDGVTIGTLEARINLLVYISKKYPGLTEFMHKNDNTILNTNEADNLFENGWTPFFKKLGPQLNKLCLDNRVPMNHPFVTLDGFGCQIQQLEITNLSYSSLTKIAESHQLHYIQNLTLKDTKFQSFYWLNNLRVLTHLKITHARYGITFHVNMNLGDILDNAPLLESLYLHRVTLVLPSSYTGLSGIKSLFFRNVDLPEGIDVFLSQHIPKLSKLTLQRCRVPENTLRLPAANLTSFAYYDDSSNKEENVLVVTASNNERRMYTVNGDMNGLSAAQYRMFYREMYPPSKFRIVVESEVKPWFTLYCNSLYNISFNE